MNPIEEYNKKKKEIADNEIAIAKLQARNGQLVHENTILVAQNRELQTIEIRPKTAGEMFKEAEERDAKINKKPTY